MIDIDWWTHVALGICLAALIVYFFVSRKARMEIEEAEDDDLYNDDT